MDQNNNIKYTPPVPPFLRYCSATIPTAFDDSLSYYEALCALYKWLQDNIIGVINNNAAVTQYYIDLVKELKSYVENYFANLDVQEEINNKLDEMAEDGTLASILQSLVMIDDTVNFHTKIAMTTYQTAGMQGGCVLPDGTIVQFTTTKAQKIADDGTILAEITHEWGHCNGATYCDKTDKIYVTSTQSDEIGRYKIFELNPTNLALVETYDMSDTFPAEPYGIVYVPEQESFVFANWWSESTSKKIWRTDVNFGNIETKTYNFEVHSTSNICRFGSNYIGIDVLTKNAMLLFDIRSLDFIKEININRLVSDTWCITEPEWYDWRNGVEYIGFMAAASASPHWGAGTRIYATYDPAKNYEETTAGKSVIPPHDEIYYVDPSVTPTLDRNGSNSKPFMNIYEALNSALREENVTGFVKIVIRHGDTDRTYSPLFNMNKKYEIDYRTNETITMFRMIGVNQSAKVIINRPITLQKEEEILNPYTYGDGGDLCIMGEFECVNVIDTSDESRLILCGSDAARCRFGISNHGLDVKDYWGQVVNSSNDLLSIATVVNNNHYVNNTKQVWSRIRGVKQTITADGNGKYFIPTYTPNGFICIKFSLTQNSTATTYEITRPYNLNTWVEEPFFDDNGKHVLQINTTGEVTISNNITITRLKVIGQ